MQFSKTVQQWRYWPKVEFSIKVAILLALIWSIYQQLFANNSVEEIAHFYQSPLSTKSIVLLVAAMVLMPINWLLEALKWQTLVKAAEPLQLKQALKAVLSGVTLSLLTPNRIGEYGGRIAFLSNPTGINQLVRTFLCGLAQLTITFLFGIIGLAMVSPLLSEFSPAQLNIIWLAAIAGCMLILLAFVYVNKLKTLPRLLGKFSPKLSNYLLHLKHINRHELLTVLGLGSLRYLVYSCQYALLLQAFGIELNYADTWAMVSVLFLLQTLIPSIAAFEIAIRGNLALFLLSSYSANTLSLMSAVLILWTINLMVPALIGYIIVWNRRFTKL